MESEEVQTLVETKVKAAKQANNGDLLNIIGDMLNTISAQTSSFSASTSVWDAPTFKRKSNEEQFNEPKSIGKTSRNRVPYSKKKYSGCKAVCY